MTLLEAINAARDSAPALFVLLGSVLVENELDNDIDDEVLFGTNMETSSGYSND